MQGDASVIVVLSGVEELEQITHTDRQITRRLRKMPLADLAEASDGDQVWAILERFCERAGLDTPTRDDLVGRLLHACCGRFGLIIETLIDAIEIALDACAPSLTCHHFAQVFGAQPRL